MMPIKGEQQGYTYKALINGEWQEITIQESPLELVERFEQDEEWTRVRHGQWVHNKWSNMRHDYSCSLCGCRIEGVDPFSLSATTYNYCPQCGAVMDGVEE